MLISPFCHRNHEGQWIVRHIPAFSQPFSHEQTRYELAKDLKVELKDGGTFEEESPITIRFTHEPANAGENGAGTKEAVNLRELAVRSDASFVRKIPSRVRHDRLRLLLVIAVSCSLVH